jgi:hypothetical protein
MPAPTHLDISTIWRGCKHTPCFFNTPLERQIDPTDTDTCRRLLGYSSIIQHLRHLYSRCEYRKLGQFLSIVDDWVEAGSLILPPHAP